MSSKNACMQRAVDLVLTGPYTGISAFGCFAIKVDIPDTTAGSSSSSGSTGRPIEWEWDCYDRHYAAEVDKPPGEWRNISSGGPGQNVKVSYAVMSNALEATVQVKLRLKDVHSPPIGVYGNITALIHGFQVGSLLFRSTEEEAGKSLSPGDGLWFVLQLARNVVAVPCGKSLHIKMDLHVKTSNSEDIKHFDATLHFKNGIPSECHEFRGDQIRVDITWYPESEVNGEQESNAAALEPTIRKHVSKDEIVEQQGPNNAAALESSRPEDKPVEDIDDEKMSTVATDEEPYVPGNVSTEETGDKKSIMAGPKRSRRRREKVKIKMLASTIAGPNTEDTTLINYHFSSPF